MGIIVVGPISDVNFFPGQPCVMPPTRCRSYLLEIKFPSPVAGSCEWNGIGLNGSFVFLDCQDLRWLAGPVYPVVINWFEFRMQRACRTQYPGIVILPQPGLSVKRPVPGTRHSSSELFRHRSCLLHTYFAIDDGNVLKPDIMPKREHLPVFGKRSNLGGSCRWVK